MSLCSYALVELHLPKHFREPSNLLVLFIIFRKNSLDLKNVNRLRLAPFMLMTRAKPGVFIPFLFHSVCFLFLFLEKVVFEFELFLFDYPYQLEPSYEVPGLLGPCIL